MTVFKNIIKENTEYEHIKEHLRKQVFPGLFYVVKIAIHCLWIHAIVRGHFQQCEE